MTDFLDSYSEEDLPEELIRESGLYGSLKSREGVDREDRDRLRIIQWLKLEHPQLIWWFDLAGESGLTTMKAAEYKSVGHKVHDFILDFPCEPFHGLRLELKRSNFQLFTKVGNLYSNEHVRDQYKAVLATRRMGYMADFASGFDDAKKKISWYLLGDHKSFLEHYIAPIGDFKNYILK